MPVPVTPPATVAQFKAQYERRGFRFGDGSDSVTDNDIILAMTMATSVFNPNLWSSAEIVMVFCVLTAHFLVWNIQATGGLNGRFPGSPGSAVDATKNVGGGVIDSSSAKDVSTKYAGLEKLIEKWPMLADFRRTDFGAQYALMIAPRLVGRVHTVMNQTSIDAAIPAVPFLG